MSVPLHMAVCSGLWWPMAGALMFQEMDDPVVSPCQLFVAIIYSLSVTIPRPALEKVYEQNLPPLKNQPGYYLFSAFCAGKVGNSICVEYHLPMKKFTAREYRLHGNHTKRFDPKPDQVEQVGIIAGMDFNNKIIFTNRFVTLDDLRHGA